MDIFIIREGRQVGPFSEGAVKAFLTEGTARPADMGWIKGMAEWRPLSEVLKPASAQGNGTAPATGSEAPPSETSISAHESPATAKQKAFLKYLGAEFGENLTKQRAALAVSDAIETPKLQPRIRKWQEDKLRLHADIYQDEIDYCRANRTNRYLERIQTEGADVLKDVTKAHVQVIVESLDKRNPGWESDPEAALWDHLLPAIGSHFPQLVQPAHEGTMKSAGGSRIARAATRGLSAAAETVMPRPQAGTLGAMIRGVLLGVIALGGILIGHHYWKKSNSQGTTAAPASPEKKDTQTGPLASKDPLPKDPALEPPGKLNAENKLPELPPDKPSPPAPAPDPVPAPAVPNDPPAPAPPINTEKPAVPAVPAIPEEKPTVPPPAAPPLTPEAPATVTPPAASAPRTAVKLVQGIGVMLPSGQVTLPAGTVLRYLANEGANVRVSWSNNVFFVPAAATDVNELVPALADPAGAPPAASGVAKPKKPADDL
jgi:hypothetical protein